MTIEFVAIVSETATFIVQNATLSGVTAAFSLPLIVALAVRWTRNRKQN